MTKFILVILVGMLFSSCIKIPRSCYQEFIFEFPVSLSGVDDTLMVGESIYIYSEIPDTLRDLNGGEEFNIQDIPIINSMLIKRISELSHEYVPDHIDFIPYKGEVQIRAFEDLTIDSKTGFEYVLDYIDTSGSRKFEGAVNFQEPGLYLIYFNSFYFNYDPGFLDDCQERLRNNYIRVNTGDISENNHQMINGVSESQGLDWIEEVENYRNSGGYAFYVK